MDEEEGWGRENGSIEAEEIDWEEGWGRENGSIEAEEIDWEEYLAYLAEGGTAKP